MILYDAEIINAIPQKGKEPSEKYNYCRGWTDYVGMQISVIVAYDYMKDRWHVFCKDNQADFWALVNTADKVVGYCSKGFDDKLVQACWPHKDLFREGQCWDLGAAVKKAAGKSMKLDDMAQSNLGYGKTGHGADAPFLWQDGQIGQVINYCTGDVRALKGLMDLVIRRGYLYQPANNNMLMIPRP